MSLERNHGKETMNPAPKQVDDLTYSGRLASRLRSLREKKKLSVDEMVVAINKAGYPISVQTYYGWENGKQKTNLDAVPAIAHSLGVSCRNLMPEE